MGHEGNYCRCSRPVLLAPADIPLVEYHSSGGGGDGQQVSLMMGKKTLAGQKTKKIGGSTHPQGDLMSHMVTGRV